jgi:inorganic pyrophosphatase
MKKIVLLIAIFTLMMACQDKKSFDDLQTYSKAGKPHFIVMNAAGSVEKFQYDNESNGFKVKTTKGVNESVGFLPYPANYGFFPSTHADGEDKGELLYGFLIASELSIQTMVDVKPLGAVTMLKDGKEEQLVLCIPDDKLMRIDMEDTNKLNEDMESIFGMWLTNAFDVDSIIGWHDANYATELIKTRSNR